MEDNNDGAEAGVVLPFFAFQHSFGVEAEGGKGMNQQKKTRRRKKKENNPARKAHKRRGNAKLVRTVLKSFAKVQNGKGEFREGRRGKRGHEEGEGQIPTPLLPSKRKIERQKEVSQAAEEKRKKRGTKREKG